MGRIKNPIQKFLDEYERFKNVGTSALSTDASSQRGFARFLKIKLFNARYGESLYENFGVRENLDFLDKMINFFGEDKVKAVLEKSDLTLDQKGDMLITPENKENFEKLCEDEFGFEQISNAITLYRATGLKFNTDSFQNGIQFDFYERKSYGTYEISNPKNGKTIKRKKKLSDILRENDVTKQDIEELYEMYGDEIVSQYIDDMRLRNKTVLYKDSEGKTSYVEDHVTDYTEDDFKRIFEKFLANEELDNVESAILTGMIVKVTDFISQYTVKHLKENPEVIKSEVKLGIFKDLVLGTRDYTIEERKQLIELDGRWNGNDLMNYQNLKLLKERLQQMNGTSEYSDQIAQIEGILSKPFSDIAKSAEDVKTEMGTLFMNYEIANRENLIERVFDPKESTGTVIIDDLTQMESAGLLHFFTLDKRMSTFENYLESEAKRKSKELEKEVVFSEEEKAAMKLQYEAKENHFITDYSMDMNFIGKVYDFGSTYITNTSNQLSALTATANDLLSGNKIRGGRLAIGFSKKTLQADAIATTSSKNIHSNKGIEYVETENSFKDFSASYEELLGDPESRENSEIVLFRNAFQSTLKPSYVMYIANDKLDSAEEISTMEKIKEEMKKAGLNVPFVVFDRYTIKEKMKAAEIQTSDKGHSVRNIDDEDNLIQ